MKNIIIMLLLIITATGYTQKKAGNTNKQPSKNITKSNAVNKKAAVANNLKISKDAKGKVIISGVISIAEGSLPGANIVVQGTQKSTQTDFDGKYSIEAKTGEILEVSFLGYDTQYITIGQSERINVVLEESPHPNYPVIIDRYRDSTKPLQGCGTVINISEIQGRNKNFNFKVSEKQIRNIIYDTLNSGWIVVKNVPNPFLNKYFNGYTIIKKQGRKKSTIAYRLAYGYTNGQSLYIIDDIPTDEDGFKLINQNTIKLFEVIKDKAANSESGNRGAGAIMRITTNMSRKEKKKFREMVESNEISDTNTILQNLQGNLPAMYITSGDGPPGKTTNKAEPMPFRRIDKKVQADSNTTTPGEQFTTDLKNNSLRLYVLGGIAAVITSKDKEFAQQSGFTYHDFGCLAPPDIMYYETYNRLVLDHLKLNLKTGWQKQVVLNTIGLQNWKEKQ